MRLASGDYSAGTLHSMDWETYLGHIRSDSALVAQAARRALEPWGCGPIGDLTVDGDLAVVELLRQAAKEETQ